MINTLNGKIKAQPEKYGNVKTVLLESRDGSELASDGPFDLIICTFVLSHIELELCQPVFDNLASFLAPGGHLYLSDFRTVEGEAAMHGHNSFSEAHFGTWASSKNLAMDSDEWELTFDFSKHHHHGDNHDEGIHDDHHSSAEEATNTDDQKHEQHGHRREHSHNHEEHDHSDKHEGHDHHHSHNHEGPMIIKGISAMLQKPL
jgi:hypothetical protein